MKSALLVIDVQQALCTGPYAAFEARSLIDRINQVSDKARVAGVPVVFIQHEASDGVLDCGSAGWQLAQGLNALPSDVHVRKTASDSFHKTELEAILQRLEIQALVVCGLQTEFCVDTTVRRALGLGYPVTLVSDAHSTMDNEVLTAAQIVRHHNLTLACLDSFGPRVTPTPASAVRFGA
jgi:nicotinamidase-related amidase